MTFREGDPEFLRHRCICQWRHLDDGHQWGCPRLLSEATVLVRMRELKHDRNGRCLAIALAVMSGRRTALDYCPEALSPREFAEAVYCVVRTMGNIGGATVIETSRTVVRLDIQATFGRGRQSLSVDCGERVHMASKILRDSSAREVCHMTAAASLPARVEDVLPTAARLLPSAPF